jgi:hypothetical protein
MPAIQKPSTTWETRFQIYRKKSSENIKIAEARNKEWYRKSIFIYPDNV